MPEENYTPVAEGDTPNAGRETWNAHISSLDERVGGLEDAPDNGGLTEAQGDARYVRITGDPDDGDFFQWQESSGTVVPVDAPGGGGGAQIPTDIALIAQSGNGTFGSSVAVAEVSAIYRRRFDLTNVSEARIVVRIGATAANSGAKVSVQYSADGTTWSYLDGTSGPVTPTDVSNSTQAGSWVALASGAKADVHLRIVTVGATGNFNTAAMHLQVR